MRIIPSPLKKKKWRAEFDDGTHADFGDPAYEDYTQHGDEKRRASYRARHKPMLDKTTPKDPAYLSYYLLWGDSKSLEQNIRNYKKRFNV